ncbi:Lipoprotein-releasing system transmembrane protein LolE [Gemmata obscuriglobus]|uniref:ABC transporter permease n=1 Tax=Gemmata obscuriglobus TaxID=114 RepID=A0A2Z3HB17_9BACT|nr:FtsX-like permease family protein [Gemmata obscuriglobus]AWM40896.1 ABC transporter permease [Gemmata obscuriglobus]QEG25804.1 Lipoprotein-releasing system transmembrane protein LolE [Gemmata obscuriglobus]VTR99691.1 membrane protein : ABC-type transport system, involved in lipoprotein release, permease component OS=Singulisphaera acidiphila (strain ATCC BAA-1392 / DSM 18658 / VKM B-2454 / MOB10) GN=Sinac_5022 PE=4 SV=1: MacB_PCD: FtsX [Gemmata obscuriglobus UQM 2246]
MYKLLLCVRYLQTRYLAFICIVSVMLGVATLIVVNAVMSGFGTKLKDRLHGVLSDVVVDTDRPDGFYVLSDDPDPDRRRPLTPDEIVAKIKSGPVGDRIEALTPTIETFAIIRFQCNGTNVSKPVRLIGVDPQGRAEVGGFSEYLVRQKDAPRPSFDLTPEALQRHEWNIKQARYEAGNVVPPLNDKGLPPLPDAIPEPKMDEHIGIPKPKLHGVIPGHSIAHFRYKDKNGQPVEECVLKPGDDVVLITAGGQEMKPVWGSFIVTDYLKTEMSEYDQSFVYVPLEQLQHIRGMIGRATAFQVKLKNYDRDKELVTQELRKVFPHADVRVATWEEHQGPLLSAIDIERGILNLLLFMIVGVAGFSILAIFTMIVSEKYRDIGVMKSLGASSAGVMSIFLSYGLLLGVVGSLLGTALGLTVTRYINEIEAALTVLTGRAVFPKDIYYFKEIPTNVEPVTVIAVNVGAVLIATVFSLLPAWRAARLHPVQALRFE